MAKPEQFDAVYEQEMKDFMSLGGTQLKEELEAALKDL